MEKTIEEIQKTLKKLISNSISSPPPAEYEGDCLTYDVKKKFWTLLDAIWVRKYPNRYTKWIPTP